MTKALHGFEILCISTSPWERPWGSRQQIMSRLAKDNTVLFIEVQYSLLHWLKYPATFTTLFSLRRTRTITPGLCVYNPLPVLPFGYRSLTINKLNQRFLAWQLRRLCKERNTGKKLLLWIFEPTSFLLPLLLQPAISVYHCIDNFSKEQGFFRDGSCITRMELELCKTTNLIFFSASVLQEGKESFKNKMYYFPSATDEMFLEPRSSWKEGRIAAKIAGIPSPRIGFVATLDGRIDYALLEYLAHQRVEWQFLIAGEKTNALPNTLSKLANVHLLGYIPPQDLPQMLSQCNACILPYKVNDFTKGISPIKIVEYCAFGAPIVATALPELFQLEKQGVVALAATKETFLLRLENAMHNDTHSVQRKEFAQRNTWETRVDMMSVVLKEALTHTCSHTAI